MKIQSHRDVLAEGRKWRRDNTRDSRSAAAAVLAEGMKRYPDALPLGEELVLVYKENGDLDAAIQVLRSLDQRFRHVGEETLCRWGSVLRLRANAALARDAGPEQARFWDAETALKEAEAYYARAFEEFHTHYPRINQLTTRFARAGLARAMNDVVASTDLVASVKADAAAMLADREIWGRPKPQDEIWAAASRGEAYLLLGREAEASAAYREAVRAAGADEFPRASMARQVRETLIPALRRLDRDLSGELASPDVFFGLPPAAAPAPGDAGTANEPPAPGPPPGHGA